MHLLGFAPPAANLLVGEKKLISKEGGGNDQNAQYISLILNSNKIHYTVYLLNIGIIKRRR